MPASLRGSPRRLIVNLSAVSKSMWLTKSDICRMSVLNNQLLRYQSTSNRDKGNSTITAFSTTRQNLIDSLNQNLNWINRQYENAFGIAEIRKMQEKVLDAESGFVEITAQRKSIQDQIDALKDNVKSLRDKLESTPRQSDSYLDLITQEHRLLREQLTLEVQLSQLKEREQMSLDNLSKLLRQSHELERLRQERSKYWQIISVSLSLVGSFIALMAQRARSQKFIEKELEGQRAIFTDHFRDMNESVHSLAINLDKLVSRVDKIESNTEFLVSNSKVEEAGSSRGVVMSSHQRSARGWFWWIPGLSYMTRVTRYLY